MRSFLVTLVLLSAFLTLAIGKSVSLSSIYGNSMVLSRRAPLVWGYGDAGATITTTLNQNTKYQTTVSSNNIWTQKLPAQSASLSSPNTLTFTQSTDNSQITLTDILFGDVYVCAGEGNMAMTVSSTYNSSVIINQANAYPNIRLFATSQLQAGTNQAEYSNIVLPWNRASSAIVGNGNWTLYSAACWAFGTNLYDSLQGTVPIGLISLTFSPSPLQTWLPSSNTAGNCGTYPPSSSSLAPHSVYNGLVSPLVTNGPVTLDGFLFWQGESNSPPNGDDALWYGCALPAFITDLRTQLNNSTLYFGIVQLPPVMGPFWTDSWPMLRNAQAVTANTLPNVGLIVTIDLGDVTSPFTNFLSRNKTLVGARLAASTMVKNYGGKGSATGPSQPTAVAVTSNSSAFVTITVTFDPVSVTNGITLVNNVCPPGVPQDDPNNGWGEDICIGWRVLTGYPKYPPVPVYQVQNPGGFLAAGNDLPGSGSMTIQAAEAACTANILCVGFTFASTDPNPSGPVNIYLKSAFNFVVASGWQAYNSTRKPVGEWYNAQAAVGSDGKSVTITATLPNIGDTTVSLQYGYGTWPLATLFDTNGYPAAPFMINVTSATVNDDHRSTVTIPSVSIGQKNSRRLQPWLQLQPYKFNPLPLGTVKPSGWLLTQLSVERYGMSGYLHIFYPPVAYSPWIVDCSTVPGGCQDTNCAEDFPYWFAAAVPLAVLTDDPSLLTDITNYVDHILSTQDSSGWLGPAAADTDGNSHWCRWPVLSGLIAFYEATNDARILPAVYAYLHEAYRRLTTAAPLGGDWAGSRWQDFAYLLEIIIDKDPQDTNGEKQFLISFLWLVYGQQTVDWESWYTLEFFPTGNTGWNYSAHGVNSAQGLKSGAVIYRMSGSMIAYNSSFTRLQLLDTYHGAPTGMFLADETLSDSTPSHGTELCAVVESMFSLNVMHEYQGDPSFAERAEKIAYNALPGTWSSDMWNHQYLQMPNSYQATDEPSHIWLADGPDATTFGVAPNYPCCAANGPQGWPRFVPRMLKTTNDNGIAVSLLGPVTAVIPLPSTNDNVNITVDTEYPFGDSVDIYLSNVPTNMPLYIRIPSWATNANISIDNNPAYTVGDRNGTMYRLVLATGGNHIIRMELNPEIYVDSIGVLYNGAITLHRGALVYGMHLQETYNITGGMNTTIPAHPFAESFEILPTASVWNAALIYDPSDPAGPSKYFTFTRTGNVNATQPFDHSTPPLQITANAREVYGWTTALNAPTAPPASPACSQANACGSPFPVTFYPYGMTHIRMSVLPWSPN